jgi:hypothetical protein
MTLSDSESSNEDVGQANKNMYYEPFSGACSSNEPHLLTQGHLNDTVHDLNLSKKQAELLGSRLVLESSTPRDSRCAFLMGALNN